MYKKIILISLILLLAGCIETENTIEENPYIEYVEIPKKIEQAPDLNIQEIELKLHELINEERKKEGLQELNWDINIANVARRHSENQAEYNENTTKRELVNPIPLIYHEGFEFGFYQDDRLDNSGVHDFSMSGENISINSIIDTLYYETYGIEHIQSFHLTLTNGLYVSEDHAKEQILKTIKETNDLALDGAKENWVDITYKNSDEFFVEIVEGWMDSPGHRENILDGNFDRTGIGVAKVNDYYIATQVFVQTAECGYETGPCCYLNSTRYYPSCYEPLYCVFSKCIP